MAELLLPQPRWRRRLISVLLLAHLIMVPWESVTRAMGWHSGSLERACSRYLFAIRVRQLWALFSPEPRRQAIKYRAEIVHRDGQREVWQRPYPPKWGFFARHLSYNYQKWDLVSGDLDYQSPLWDSLVHFLEPRYQSLGHPISEIRFIRSSAPWPPPSPQGYVGGEIGDLKWTDRTLFVYDEQMRNFR